MVIVAIALGWGHLAASTIPRPVLNIWSPPVGRARVWRWIYVGLGISVPVLAACTVWILFVLGQVMHPARPAAR